MPSPFAVPRPSRGCLFLPAGLPCVGGAVWVCRAGDEPIESVRFRAEEAEFPTYREGAFRVHGCAGRPDARALVPLPNHLQHMVAAVRFDPAPLPAAAGAAAAGEQGGCEEWVHTPTLFVTRYEYANLFHTLGTAALLRSVPHRNAPQRTGCLFIR